MKLGRVESGLYGGYHGFSCHRLGRVRLFVLGRVWVEVRL